MVDITEATLTDLLNDSVITAANAEKIIDQAIHLLNLYGAELSNMGGVAGSKTLSVESKQAGAILLVARQVYYSFYKGVEQTNVGGITYGTPDLLRDPVVVSVTEKAARRLTELDVSVG